MTNALTKIALIGMGTVKVELYSKTALGHSLQREIAKEKTMNQQLYKKIYTIPELYVALQKGFRTFNIWRRPGRTR